MSTTNEWTEQKSPWAKFNVVGDYVQGTLVGVREIPSSLPGMEGQMIKVYEIKTDEGSMHDLDDKKKVIEEAMLAKEGEVWNLGGGSNQKPNILDGQFRNIKLGQKVKVEFTEERKSKQAGFNPLKVKKVYTNGKVDQEWLDEQEATKSTEEDF